MKGTLLTLVLFSLIACKKQDITIRQTDSTNLVAKIDQLQSTKEVKLFAKENQLQLSHFFDTCSKDVKAHIQAKLLAIFQKESPKQNPNTKNALTSIDEPPTMYGLDQPTISDDYQVEESLFGKKFYYQWIAAHDASFMYWIRSSDVIYYQRTLTYPNVLPLEVEHIASYEEGLGNWYYEETSHSGVILGNNIFLSVAGHLSSVLGPQSYLFGSRLITLTSYIP